MKPSIYPIAFCAYGSAILGGFVTAASMDNTVCIIAALSTLAAFAIAITATIEISRK